MMSLEDRIEKIILEAYADVEPVYDGRSDGAAHDIIELLRSIPEQHLRAAIIGELLKSGEQIDAK